MGAKNPYERAYEAAFREGYRDGLLRLFIVIQLSARFGALTADQSEAVQRLSFNELLTLGIKLVTASSLAELGL